MHISLALVPAPQPGAQRTPFLPSWWRTAVDPAWPVSCMGASPALARTLGWVLWLAVTVAFTLAAAALLLAPGDAALWQGLAVAEALTSLALLGLYWHPWLPVGVLINLAILAAVWMRWPLFQFAP